MNLVDLDEVQRAQEAQFAAAKLFMELRKGRKGILIYCGSQHPLVPGKDGRRNQPGLEFSARIDKAIELLKMFKARGYYVQIFVSGSLHQYEGVWDDAALREAAVNDLKVKGAADEDIVSDDVLAEIMAECNLTAIGNGQDEVQVVTTCFKMDERFGYLYAVGGHAQLARMLEGALVNGVLAIGVTPVVLREDGTPFGADEHWHGIGYEAVATARQAVRLTDPDAAATATAADALQRESRTAPKLETPSIADSFGAV